MSAFAARQQLWGAAASGNRVLVEEATPELPTSDDEPQSGGSRRGLPSVRSGSDRTSRGQSAEETIQGSADADHTQSTEGGKASPGYADVFFECASQCGDTDGREQDQHTPPRVPADSGQTTYLTQAEQEKLPA
jgi:hypothetical protein